MCQQNIPRENPSTTSSALKTLWWPKRETKMTTLTGCWTRRSMRLVFIIIQSSRLHVGTSYFAVIYLLCSVLMHYNCRLLLCYQNVFSLSQEALMAAEISFKNIKRHEVQVLYRHWSCFIRTFNSAIHSLFLLLFYLHICILPDPTISQPALAN